MTEIDTATQQRPAGHSPFESAVDHDAATLYVTDDLTALSGFVENIQSSLRKSPCCTTVGPLAAHLLTGTGHDGLEEFHRGWIELIAETGDGQGVEHADCATWIGNPLKLRHGREFHSGAWNFTNSPSPHAPFVDRARGHYVDGTHILTKAPRPRLNSLPLGTGRVANRLSSLAYGGA